MRTLSKFGLAGVRLGYLMRAAALIDEIDKVRPPYNISVLNCRGARCSRWSMPRYTRARPRVLRAERGACCRALAAHAGGARATRAKPT